MMKQSKQTMAKMELLEKHMENVTMKIEVREGVGPGDVVLIDSPDGHQHEVQVSKGFTSLLSFDAPLNDLRRTAEPAIAERPSTTAP